MADKTQIGKVSHYFTRMSVAVVELTDELEVGDKILVEGAITTFTQTVDSMQIDRDPVKSAPAGQSIGISMHGKVREGDLVYKLTV